MKFTRSKLPLLMALLPLSAHAHFGHAEHGFLDGLAHPFLGLDHLLAMVVVGIWAIVQPGRRWVPPMMFLAALTLGTLFGQLGITLPALESMVAASVLCLGVMLATPVKLSTTVTLGLMGGFAFLHGAAHGGELTASVPVIAGILLGSAALHASGMAMAVTMLQQKPHWVQVIGQTVALLGGGLILSSVV